MNMRIARIVPVALAAVVPFAAVFVSGCEPSDRLGPNQIIFAIHQTVDTETPGGKIQTYAAWDLIGLDGKGTSQTTFIDRGRRCYAEDLAEHLGQPQVENGTARFRGGLLPAAGLSIVPSVLGTSGKVTLDGAGWQNGDLLTFDAHGFAMPHVGPVTMATPSTDLEIEQPAAAPEISVDPTADFVVAWSTKTVGAENDRVVVAFDVDDKTGKSPHVRCFFDHGLGQAVVPSSFLKALERGATGRVKGSLRIGTHRQLTLQSPGEWWVYVVAVAHRQQHRFIFP